jgi:hypothetical protein
MQNITCLPGLLLALGVSLLGAACGGSDENAATGSSSGAGGDASSSSSTSSSATATGSGGQGTTGTGSTGAGGAGGQGTGGAAPGGITPTLESSQFGVNCQPIVAPDPILGSFTAKYANSGAGPLGATVSSAKLTFSAGPNSAVWPFTVSPPGGGPVQPGTTLSVEHTKQNNPGGGRGAEPCSFCNGTWTLSVTWDLGGGKSASDTLPAEPVSCVF